MPNELPAMTISPAVVVVRSRIRGESHFIIRLRFRLGGDGAQGVGGVDDGWRLMAP